MLLKPSMTVSPGDDILSEHGALSPFWKTIAGRISLYWHRGGTPLLLSMILLPIILMVNGSVSEYSMHGASIVGASGSLPFPIVIVALFSVSVCLSLSYLIVPVIPSPVIPDDAFLSFT